MNSKRLGWRVGTFLSFTLGALAACTVSESSAPVDDAVAVHPHPAASDGKLTSASSGQSSQRSLSFEHAVAIRYRTGGPPLTMQTQSAGITGLGEWQAHANLDITPIATNDKDCHTRPLRVAAWGAAKVTEVWCDRGKTLEHAYQFAERPDSKELLVEVEVHGVRRGLALSDRVRLDTVAGLALNYGKAAWLDANGVRHPVALGWRGAENRDGGTLLLRVSAETLDKSAFPAVLDPELGPLTQVADSIYVPANNSGRVSAVAALGVDVAVLLGAEWVRLHSDGTVEPPGPIPVSGGSADEGFAMAHPQGVFYLIRHQLARLATSGSWLSPTSLARGQQMASVKTRSDGKIAAVEQASTDLDSYRTTISTNGVVLDQELLPTLPIGAGGRGYAAELTPQTLRYMNSTTAFDLDAGTGTTIASLGHGINENLSNLATLTDASNRTVVGRAGGVVILDANLARSAVDFSQGGLNYGASVGLAVNGDTLCVLGRLNGSTEGVVTQVDLASKTQVVSYLIPSVDLGSALAPGAPFSGGFAFGYRSASNASRGLLLDAGCQPTHTDLTLRTEPNRQNFVGIFPSGQDSWAVWLDARNPQRGLYGRRIDDSGTPIGAPADGTDFQTLVGALPDRLTSVSNTDRSAIVIHNTATDTVRALRFDGSPIPTSLTIAAPDLTVVTPLIEADGSIHVVGRRATNCGSPPCPADLVLAGESSEMSLVAQPFDYGSIISASRGTDHWLAVKAENLDGTIDVRAMRVDVTAQAVVEDVLVQPNAPPKVVIIGIAINDEGEPAVVWGDGEFPFNYRFASVRQGAAVVGGNGPFAPGPFVFASLDGGRGYLLGPTLIDQDGNLNHNLDLAGIGTLTAAISPIPGTVLVGIDADRSIYTAQVVVGDASGAPCTEDDTCSSGSCQEGVCCESECGLCERCDIGLPGKCAPAINTDDDSCFGDRSCDDAGACKPANGETCSVDSDCASGFCVDGVCCDSACDDACGACLPGVGVCTTIECGAYACAGGGECKQICESTVDCAPNFVCGADERCVTPNAAPATEEDGCGCHVVGRRTSDHRSGWLLALALGLVGTFRRARLRSNI